MQVLGNSDGVEAPRAHAQRKKPLPEPGVVREGFLEEEKLKPAGVRVGGWPKGMTAWRRGPWVSSQRLAPVRSAVMKCFIFS